MTATTVSAPVIGIAHVDGYQVQVQVRPGSNAAWLTLLGETELDTFTVGTISGLDGDMPQLHVFQRLQRWATPSVQHSLTTAVTRLYRDFQLPRERRHV